MKREDLPKPERCVGCYYNRLLYCSCEDEMCAGCIPTYDYEIDWEAIPKSRYTPNNWAEYIGRWRREKGFETSYNNMPEKLMLVVTELAEAMEEYRDMFSSATRPIDEYNKAKKAFMEEIADTFIRLFDIADAIGMDISAELEKKMAKNWKRPYRHGRQC